MLPRILHPGLAPGPNELSEEDSHHLIRVLRARQGDALVLFNGQGLEAQAVLTEAHPQACLCLADDPQQVLRESPTKTTVLQALCTGDKMDWVVQKACELGASRLLPVRTQRAQLKLDGDRAHKRQQHWQRIADSAAAQCGRNRVLLVEPVMGLEEALADFKAHSSTGWLLDPFAQASLSTAPLAADLTIAIGPEAGWSDQEEAQMLAAGFHGLRCGPRILRTETAAVVVLSAIAVRLGEF